jgi:hypothetical protein
MAVVNNVEYCGKDSQELYASAVLTGMSKSRVRKFLNVKNSLKVRNIETNDEPLQEADCVFSSNADTSLNEKEIAVCKFKINEEYCVDDFENSWISDNVTPGANTGKVMPDNIERYIVDRIMEKVSNQLEFIFWRGDTASSSYPLCDGMLKMLDADAEVVHLDAAVITSSNVIAEFTRIYNAIPQNVKFLVENGKPQLRLKWFVSASVLAAYKLAQAASTYGTMFNYLGDKPLDFMGYEIIYAPGLIGSEVVVADPQNLWLGTDLESDFENVRIINMMETLGQPTVRIVGRMNFGVLHGVGSEIVLYN